MPRTFADLSIFLENDVLSDPPAFAPKIEYFTHENTFAQIEPFFPGLQKNDLPDGEGWAVERVQLSKRCRRAASTSPVTRTRSAGLRRVGHAPWRSSTTN